MQKRITLLLVYLFTLSAMAFAKPDEIYLMIGQSNMAGRAEVTPELATPLKSAFLLNDKGEWEPAQNPLNRYSTVRKGMNMQRLGPGYGFAREMIAQRPDVTIGLVVNAKGGSKIDVWEEGGKFFEDAVKRTKQAMEAGGNLKGICWHQGESNANDPDYLEKIKALVTAFRNAFDDPALPFVVGETCKAQSERPVNKHLNQLPDAVSMTACVKADGLKAYDGNTHFDTDSQLELGKRYATEMLRLLKDM
jgi:hypothetical protein